MSQPEVERRAPDARAPVRRPVQRHSASALPERLSRHLVLYGVVLVVLQLAFRGWALAGSWFYFDDIAFMSRAMNEPLDASYLLESYGGHLMPGGFLTAWLLTKVAVYSWAPWAAVLLFLQALAGFGMLRLLVSLFGRRPLVLALLAGYLAYVFTLSAGIWFAAGINQLPMQVALVFGLHAHVEYLRHRRIRSLVWAIAWTLAGLVFYEKTLLLLGVYAIVALRLVLHRRHARDRLRHLWDALPRRRPRVRRAGRRLPRALRPVRPRLLPRQRQHPAVEPDRLQPGRDDDAARPDRRAAAMAAAVGRRLRRPDRKLSCWSRGSRSRRWWCTPSAPAPRAAGPGRLLAFTAVCNVVLLASARANVVGPDIAREYRYQTESAALFVIGVGLAFLPLLGATEVNELREPEAPEQPDEQSEEPTARPVVPTAAEPDNLDWLRHHGGRRARRAGLQHALRRPVAGPQPVQASTSPTSTARSPAPRTSPCRWWTSASRRPCCGPTATRRTPTPTCSATVGPDRATRASSVDRLYIFDDQGRLAPVDVASDPHPARRRRLRVPAGEADDDHPAQRPGHRWRLVAADLLRRARRDRRHRTSRWARRTTT